MQEVVDFAEDTAKCKYRFLRRKNGAVTLLLVAFNNLLSNVASRSNRDQTLLSLNRFFEARYLRIMLHISTPDFNYSISPPRLIGEQRLQGGR